jgi:hypothetical protein
MSRDALPDALDRQQQVDLAARLVARHLTLGHSLRALIVTLARAVLREDAGFHAYLMLEAGVTQFALLGDTDEGRRILIAVSRYLAAHSPTKRAELQTADIARPLMRGDAANRRGGWPHVLDAGSEGEVSSIAFPHLGDTALVDRENFDLVVARQDNFTRRSADQSARDGRRVRY